MNSISKPNQRDTLVRQMQHPWTVAFVLPVLSVLFVPGIAQATDGTVLQITAFRTLDGVTDSIFVWKDGAWVNQWVYHDPSTSVAITAYRTIGAGSTPYNYQFYSSGDGQLRTHLGVEAYWTFTNCADGNCYAGVDNNLKAFFYIDTKEPEPPNPPSNVTATPENEARIHLTWSDNSTNEQGFRIERKIGSGSYSFLANVGTNEQGYYDNTVQPNTQYTYRVASYNIAGSSSWAYSNTVGTPPKKATNPSPTDGASSVPINSDISWSNGGGATSYDVYFGTDSTPDSGEYKVNQSSTSYDPGPLEYGITYYWKIDAKNTYGTTAGTVWSFETVLGPDLVVSVLTPPEIYVSPNQSFSITTKVRNQGSTAAVASKVGFYVSSSPTTHGSRVAQKDVSSLSAGSESATITQGFEASFTDEVIYIFTRADDGLVVTESNENNNWSDDTLSPGCVKVILGDPEYQDLQSTVDQLSDPNPVPNQQVTVNYTVQNAGTETESCNTFTNSIRWSTDATITLSDPELISKSMSGMPGGNSKQDSVQVVIPSNAVPGTTYYIGVYADSTNVVNETDGTNSYEGNNASPGVPVPSDNAQITSFNPPVEITPIGSQLTATVQVTNRDIIYLAFL